MSIFPFTGTAPDDQLVILVRVERGFLVSAGELTVTKGEITKPPE